MLFLNVLNLIILFNNRELVGCEPWLDVEDMVETERPDYKSVLVYFNQLKGCILKFVGIRNSSQNDN